MRAVNRRQRFGQPTIRTGHDARRVYHAADLDDPVGVEVLDVQHAIRSQVRQIDGDLLGPVQHDALDDGRGELRAARHVDGGLPGLLTPNQVGDLGLVFLAPARPVMGVEAALALIFGPGVLRHQVGALAEIRHVLREMPARLGRKGPKVAQHLEADDVLLVDLGLLHRRPQPGQHVLAVSFQLGKPREVVDPGGAVGQLLLGNVQVPGDLAQRVLNRVAQPVDPQLRASAGEQHQGAHGVGVVHDHGVRGQVLNVVQDLQPGGRGPQEFHHAAGAGGVADALVHAVVHGDVVVVPDVLETGHLDGVNHEVGAGQQRAPVGAGPDREGLAAAFHRQLGQLVAQGQAHRVGVDQGEFTGIQSFNSEYVGDHLLGEHGAARPDDGDFGHGVRLLEGKIVSWNFQNVTEPEP